MASPISCLSILLILLLVTSLFYQISNAIDKAFLEKVCHKSFDYELCLSTLRSDERTSTADPNGLVLISISINMNLVNSTINRIPDILKTLKDPLDKTRLMNCQTDFIYVLNKLSQGYTQLSSQHHSPSCCQCLCCLYGMNRVHSLTQSRNHIAQMISNHHPYPNTVCPIKESSNKICPETDFRQR
ncbi:cell wall / vacuolar inhibitor of fructosidase 2 [Quercus suber]|uniref:Cell wall / vacuolar inhibitor of fructosidase 2 n=1 Tax=Quercus suber TaxID=58331 RepID=A0AAW0KY71_QUESU